MTKRQKAAEERRQQEIAAIECELRLIAAGAYGYANVEDADSEVFLYGVLGCKGWLTFIQAMSSYWKFQEKNADGHSHGYMVAVHNLHHYESIEGAARFLYEQGARPGGNWEPKR